MAAASRWFRKSLREWLILQSYVVVLFHRAQWEVQQFADLPFNVFFTILLRLFNQLCLCLPSFQNSNQARVAGRRCGIGQSRRGFAARWLFHWFYCLRRSCAKLSFIEKFKSQLNSFQQLLETKNLMKFLSPFQTNEAVPRTCRRKFSAQTPPIRERQLTCGA